MSLVYKDTMQISTIPDLYIVDEIVFNNKQFVESVKISRRGGKDTKILRRDEIISLLSTGTTIYVKKSTSSPTEAMFSTTDNHSKLALDDRIFTNMVVYHHHVTNEPIIATEDKIPSDNLTATAWAPII